MQPKITTCDFPRQNKKRQGKCLRIQRFHSQKFTLNKEALPWSRAIQSEKNEETPKGAWVAHIQLACYTWCQF